MTDSTKQGHDGDKHIRAYNRMMERVNAAFRQAGENALPPLQRTVETAKETAVKLGELTRDEAELIGAYLKRDLHDAAAYLAATGSDLSQWLRFDIRLIENRLLEMFSQAADQTKLELLRLAAPPVSPNRYHTGEITGPGTLQCSTCNKVLHLHATGHIPPCPECHGTVFTRVAPRSGS